MNKIKLTNALLVCMFLTACGDSSTQVVESVVTPEGFNFVSITATNNIESPEELLFKWTGNVKGSTFEICIFDDRSLNDCSLVTTINEQNQVKFNLPLTKYVGKEFFIISKNGLKSEISKRLMIDSPEMNKLTQYIKASAPNTNDKFGFSTAISFNGLTMAVGNSSTSRGAVSIFKHDGTKWIEKFKIDSEINDLDFGQYLSLSGDGSTLAIASPTKNIVYIYEQSVTGWNKKNDVVSDNSVNGDDFGFSVNLSFTGNELIVGAPLEDSNGIIDVGAAYVFVKTNGEFIQNKRLQGSKLQKGDEFGYSTKISGAGNTIAVSAWKDDLNFQGISELNGDFGAVYLFSKVNEEWTEEYYLKSETLSAKDQFGVSISLDFSGKTLATGARTNRNNFGAAYVSKKNADNQWLNTIEIIADDLQPGDAFARNVMLSPKGTTLAISSLYDKSNVVGINGVSNGYSVTSGAVRLFQFDSVEWKQTAFIKAPNSEELDFFSHAISLSNNGKLVISAPRESSSASGLNGDMHDNSSPLSGAVFVY